MNEQLASIMQQLSDLGTEQTRKIYKNHGVRGEVFGVKISDLKEIQKKNKKNHELALALFATGNVDAMYLAALVADPAKMTKEDLQTWAEKAEWHMISEYSVAWVASESRLGWVMANEWIKSPLPHIAACGWSTLSSLVKIKKDTELDIKALSKLLDYVIENIHNQRNRPKYTMNGFVISVGSFVASLTEKAKETAKTIGLVKVYMGKTACKVPDAVSSIIKVEEAGKIGKKRKTAIC